MSRSVGEFTLMGHLGEGSFATVFLARQRETGREFAMKAISRSRVQGKLQENLESEISILKSFRHGNIVELYDIKKTERHIYLVLEYCAGGDLRALIRKEGRLTESSARHFMRHLGAGLHFLWCKNLVHRDLKPQNLLLSSPGLDATLKIADFGFARHLAKASMAETVCGSPLYMAPEVLQGYKYGASADLWSVGAILFEMLAGRPPFGGANQILLLANIRRGPNPPARKGFYPMPEGVPLPGQACSELLCRLLVPDPQNRASFREFFRSDVLRHPAAGSPGLSVESEPSSSSPSSRSSIDNSRRNSTVYTEQRSPGNSPISSETTTKQMMAMAPSRVDNNRTAAGRGRDASRIQEKGSNPTAVVTIAYSGGSRSSREGGEEFQRSMTVSAASDRGQGQGQVQQAATPPPARGGGWWPLAGWRWGGGGAQEEAASRPRGVEEDGRFKPLARTYSEPPVAVQHQHQRGNRLQTPPSRGSGGGDYYPTQQQPQGASASGRSSSSSRGGGGGHWGGPNTVPSRPPLTPPSPAQGSSSSRRGGSGGGRGGGARPIPIRQKSASSLRSGGGGRGGGRASGSGAQHNQYEESSSPSDAVTGRKHSGSGYPLSSQWPSCDNSPGDSSRRGDGDSGPLRSHERQRLRSHTPNSAPEISYMGYAASKARERGAAAAAAAAAGIRGVAFSLAGDKSRPPSSVDLGWTVSQQQGGSAQVGMRDIEQQQQPSGSGRRSRLPSLDLDGVRPRREQPLPRDLGARAGTAADGGPQQLVVAPPTAAVVAESSLQTLGSSPPERYPLQVATMINNQRQRLWSGVVGMEAGAGGAPRSGVGVGDVGGGGLPFASDDVQGDVVVTGDFSGGVKAIRATKLEQKYESPLLPGQQQGRRSDSGGGDGSGGSDDFVLVGSSTSPENESGPPPTATAGRSSSSSNSCSAGGQHAHPAPTAATAYRSGGNNNAVGEEGDNRSLGTQLVAAGGRQAWGGDCGQGVFGLHQGSEVGGGQDSRYCSGEAHPLSLEGIMRCLQIVELFGRRAVLLAELGDSCVAPAMQGRRRESLEAHALAAIAWGNIAGGRSTTSPGRSFAQCFSSSGINHNDVGALSRDGVSKPPLFASNNYDDCDTDNPWFSSASSPAGGGGGASRSCAGSGFGFSALGGGKVGGGARGCSGGGGAASNSSACCDSHRLFGEALVLYLKSLSMAKEAIVWGNQALESLPAEARQKSQQQQPPPLSPSSSVLASPPPPPPGSPHLQAPRGKGVVDESGSVQQQQHDDFLPSKGHSQGQHRQRKEPSGVAESSSASQTSSSSLNADTGVPFASAPRLQRPDTGPSVGGGGGGGERRGVTAGSSSSDARQVAARGASLLEWLTGQFSAILRRAERCRTELRGSEAAAATATAGAGKAGVLAREESGALLDERAAAGAGADNGTSLSRGEGPAVASFIPAAADGTAALSPPCFSASNAGSPSNNDMSTGKACNAPGVSLAFEVGGGKRTEGGHHGAASGAVAVSARDIVVRAALLKAQESAASEVLGMWELARKGYEKAALLLETLLLHALVAKPEGSAINSTTTNTGLLRRSNSNSSNNSNNSAGQSGTAVLSPRSGGLAAAGVGGGGESVMASGAARGGVLTEADQRALQNYMARFARRAVDVARIEKEEARQAAAVTASTTA